MRDETLDDAIDRVAREWTTVAPDPGFADRLRDRLTERRRWRLMPALVASGAAAAVVLAVLLIPQTGGTPVRSELPAKALTPFAGLSAAVEGGTFVSPSSASAIAEASARLKSGPSLPPRAGEFVGDMNAESGTSVAPLPGEGPAPLAVAELSVTPMVMPDEVEVAAIEVAPLDVPELQIANDPKEQR